MMKLMYAMLAVLGLSLATGGLVNVASADTHLYPPNQNQGSNS